MRLKEKEYISRFLRRDLVPLILVISLLVISFLALQNVFRIPNVSGVSILSSSIGVYWDAGGKSNVATINWGNVSVGSEKDVTVYVKNLGPSALVLSMNTSAWIPSTVYPKMYLCWNYSGQHVGSGSVVKVTLRLFVTPGVSGVSSFSFNINIGVGLQKSPDINGDGKINDLDLALLAKAWGSLAGEPNYDYRCDFNNDGVVGARDLGILSSAWS